MSFTSDGQTPENRLEDRLRGLILNNAQPAASPQHTPLPNTQAPQSLSQNNQQNLAAEPGSSNSAEHGSPGGKRRPNQAQRRQMSSQLSIPVDARPTSNAPQSGRGFSSSTGFPPSTGGWNSSTGFASPRHYGPQSAPLSQGRSHQHQYSPRFQNHSPASPYPSQMQFQQPSPLSPMHQMHVQPQTQHGYRQQNGPQSAGLVEPNQWRGPDQLGRPQNGGRFSSRPPPQSPQLYQPGPYNSHRSNASFGVHPEQLAKQSLYLHGLLSERIPLVGIDDAEVAEKDQFRAIIEQLCRDAISKYEQEENFPKFDPASVQLKCFGSMASGFATKASDMDLALLSPQSQPAPESSESSIPRLLEKCLLQAGYGARLLTRTRVPIIKLCQRPPVRLMSDLLEERAKWESGFVAEEAEGNDPAVHPELVADEEDHENTNESHNADNMKEASNKSPEEIYAEQMKSLRQKTNQSLGDYYGSAKRLLRKVGGHDVIAGSLTHNEKDLEILEDVCRAFVNGLTDIVLRDRLSSYRSLAFSKADQPHMARSLSGVYSQIEGENLAMRWDTRPLTESSVNQETMWGQEITKWQTLLNQTHFETSQYNRTVHNALDRLRKIPSLQLLFLEQGQHDDAGQYYSRARKLLMDLGVNNVPHVENHKLSIVVSHYLSGLRDAKVREILELINSKDPLASLDSIALLHRTLQLADDYETALSKKLYSDEDREDIEQYIAILREGVSSFTERLQLMPPPEGTVLPLTSATATLITRLQLLPDPSQAHKARDRYSDHLEFRNQDNIGIQCDINFSAQLALQNTLLLRCYSLTDFRVKPLILFVKHWAKLRGINTPYRGSLSSYGYVLMVLHYLTNIANPFVCPNLQLLRRPVPDYLPPAEIAAQTTCSGCDVRFWRNEKEIADLADRSLLNHNKDPIGTLLRGFFEYYAFNGQLSTGNGIGFDWMRDVLSLRTEGGLLTKQEKGWIGARTVIETTTEAGPATSSAPIPSPSATDAIPSSTTDPNSANQTLVQTPTTSAPKKMIVKEETKEIRHRYLFAIEDPFELDHNVARTVTHNGIVAIRDEFRRAWRIIKAAGNQGSRTQQQGPQENLLEEVLDQEAKKTGLKDLMKEIHGSSVVDEHGKTIGVLVDGQVVNATEQVKPVSLQ